MSDLKSSSLVDLVRDAASAGSDFDIVESTRLMMEAKRREKALEKLLAQVGLAMLYFGVLNPNERSMELIKSVGDAKKELTGE